MLGVCECLVQLEGGTYGLGGITEPEMRLERQVGAAVVESLCHTLRSLHACSLVYDGELARLMNRKWHGQSWALEAPSNRTVNDALERSGIEG